MWNRWWFDLRIRLERWQPRWRRHLFRVCIRCACSNSSVVRLTNQCTNASQIRSTIGVGHLDDVHMWHMDSLVDDGQRGCHRWSVQFAIGPNGQIDFTGHLPIVSATYSKRKPSAWSVTDHIGLTNIQYFCVVLFAGWEICSDTVVSAGNIIVRYSG